MVSEYVNIAFMTQQSNESAIVVTYKMIAIYSRNVMNKF